jgi:CDP-diacylglycerol---glycerol-3-phosphate 3-phosphatidyltransferase
MMPPNERKPETFTDTLRHVFHGTLNAIAGFLNRLGIRPNVITAFGLIGNIAAGVLIASGRLFWGGLAVMLIWPLDALDGTIARLRQESGRYGSFVDSVTDRYSEIVVYAGLLVFFNKSGNWGDALLVFFAAVGSVMVSYTRAKAESLDFSAKIGLLSRVERYLVLVPGLLLGFPRISLWILALLANFTALQRFLHVRNQACSQDQKIDEEHTNG